MNSYVPVGIGGRWRFRDRTIWCPSPMHAAVSDRANPPLAEFMQLEGPAGSTYCDAERALNANAKLVAAAKLAMRVIQDVCTMVPQDDMSDRIAFDALEAAIKEAEGG